MPGDVSIICEAIEGGLYDVLPTDSELAGWLLSTPSMYTNLDDLGFKTTGVFDRIFDNINRLSNAKPAFEPLCFILMF